MQGYREGPEEAMAVVQLSREDETPKLLEGKHGVLLTLVEDPNTQPRYKVASKGLLSKTK